LRGADQFGQRALAQTPSSAESGEALTECITWRQVPARELEAELLEDGVPRVKIPPTPLELAECLVGQLCRGGQCGLPETSLSAMRAKGQTELRIRRKFAQWGFLWPRKPVGG
jgi:hypothetical protein